MMVWGLKIAAIIFVPPNFQIGKGVHQGCILSPCLFNLYAEYIMRNVGLEEAQAGIKIAGRNINNLRYSKHWKHLNTQKIIAAIFNPQTIMVLFCFSLNIIGFHVYTFDLLEFLFVKSFSRLCPL